MGWYREKDDSEKWIIKNINYKRSIPIYFILFILLMLSVYYYNTKADDIWSEYSISNRYEIIINVENDEHYSVLIPSIIDEDGNITPELMSDMKINGEVEIDTVNYENNSFLQVYGYGDASIFSEYYFKTHNGNSLRPGYSPYLSTIEEKDGGSYFDPSYKVEVYLLDESEAKHIDIELIYERVSAGYLYNGIGQGGSNYITYSTFNGTQKINHTSNSLDLLFSSLHGDAFAGWDFYSPVSILAMVGFSAILPIALILIFMIIKTKVNERYNDKKFLTIVSLIIIISLTLLIMEMRYSLNESDRMDLLDIMDHGHIGDYNNIEFLLPITGITYGIVIISFLIFIFEYTTFGRKFGTKEE